MKELLSFAWKVFFASWVGFLFLDFLRPGFVSQVFFVHWFLIAALACSGASLANTSLAMGSLPAGKAGKGGGRIGAILSGIVFAILVWRAGDAFGDLRIFLAILALVLPWLLLNALYD